MPFTMIGDQLVNIRLFAVFAMNFKVFALLLILPNSCIYVAGHGLLWDPPNRSSLWRLDSSATINYNDNQNFCGGKQVQYEENNGLCGPCGDNWKDSTPRANENGGIYGNGQVVRTYFANTNIQVVVNITAPHKGHFEFNLCDLSKNDGIETEECFAETPLFLLDGAIKYQIPPELDLAMLHVIHLRLPQDKTCERCVLRWHYWTGNSDGECENGEHAIGCGPQEVFRSCSDVAIKRK